MKRLTVSWLTSNSPTVQLTLVLIVSKIGCAQAMQALIAVGELFTVCEVQQTKKYCYLVSTLDGMLVKDKVTADNNKLH